MFRIIVILIGAALLYGGFNDAYSGWKQSEPTRMTVDEYLASDRSTKWVLLTDAKIDLLRAAVLVADDGEHVRRIYVPIEAAGKPRKGPTRLLLDSNEKELIRRAQKLRSLPKEKRAGYVKRHADQMIRTGELEGNIWTRATLSDAKAADIGKIVGNLDPNFALMSHGGNANLIRGLAVIVVALLVLAFGLRRKK